MIKVLRARRKRGKKMNYEKCKTCKATYDGHGGERCSLDGQPIEYKSQCCFWEQFGKWGALAEKAGYDLTATKTEPEKKEFVRFPTSEGFIVIKKPEKEGLK